MAALIQEMNAGTECRRRLTTALKLRAARAARRSGRTSMYGARTDSFKRLLDGASAWSRHRGAAGVLGVIVRIKNTPSNTPRQSPRISA